MNRLRQGLLPLDDLDAAQFEAFVLQFLASGISLAVIESSQDGDEKTSKSARYEIATASLYGASGPDGQLGIDIRAVTSTGAEWVFQCKHYASAFNLAKAKNAVAKAEQEYPTAARYFLVLSGEPVPAVRTFVDPRPKWQLWGISELSVKFFNEVPRAKQIEILRRVFPQSSDALIARLYPHHDDLLITAEQFFAPWLKENRLFNHHAKLVGREQSLQLLHDFVADPELQACILTAPGGVGKTRLLRAFGDTFSDRHPTQKLFFVDPFASQGVGSDVLRAAAKRELVVVQDDAHRTETLRDDVAAAVIEKNGKLLLSTRPQAIEELRAWLTRAGAEHARIKVIELPVLPRNDLVALAWETLPPAKRTNAEPIVERAHGSPLIVSVAARLVAEGKFTDFLTSEDFQRTVFDRFEEEGFSRVAAEGQEMLVRDTLRLIAVLAPWKQESVSIDVITEILGCTAREFQDNFERLRAAGLLVLTREGWRVVPDLFADHLVYRGCYGNDGQLTSFARHLQATLVSVATGTVLRNLAEAEWQAQLNGTQIESLLDPFWQRIQTQFAESDFFTRSQVIKEWARFGVLQPQRSMRLARLAIGLTEAPAPSNIFYAASSLHTHGQVLGELSALLEPIAVYQPTYRTAALDLLWELHRLRQKFDEHARNDPLNAIGKVAKFQVRHPIETPLAVVEWLAGKLQGVDAPTICDQSSPALAVILKPIFEHDVEDNYTEKNTFHFRTWAINVRPTRKVRSRALEVLDALVIPRGEIASLNALAVLIAAIDIVRRKFKSDVEDEVQAEWLPDRRAGLALIEKVLKSTSSPRVIHKIDVMLKHHAYRDPQADFKADCNRVRAMIPDTVDTRLARVLLSNAYEEFFHNSPREEGETKDQLRESERLWEAFTTKVANEFLALHSSPPNVIAAAESLATDYERAGMPAQFSDLFVGVARVNAAVAADCIDLILSKTESRLDYWWTALFATHRKFPDRRLTDWTCSVLRSNNVLRWRALHNSLRWVGVGELTPKVYAEVADWAKRLDDSVLKEALFSFHWTGFRGKPLDNAILENLDLTKFSDENLLLLANALEKIKYVEKGELPPTLVKSFLDSLAHVTRLDKFDEHGFLQYVADREPLAFYRMLLARVAVGASRTEDGFLPISYRPEYCLVKLPETPGYSQLAQDLFTELRQSDEKSRHWWQQLFQIAVLRVSPIGLEMIRSWTDSVRDASDLESLIDILKFDGSMYIFEQPELTKKILQQIQRFALLEVDRFNWDLAQTASPQMRGYTNHQLDPEHRYYREEAAKAAEIHSTDPELGPFYREIVRAEDADAARNHRWAELEFSDWS